MTPGAASQLAVTTLVTGAISGAAFTPQPAIAVLAAAGNTLTSDNSTIVTMAISAGATVIGIDTVTALGCVATFVNVGLSGLPPTYTLTFTAGALTAATQVITSTTSGLLSELTNVAFRTTIQFSESAPYLRTAPPRLVYHLSPAS